MRAYRDDELNIQLGKLIRQMRRMKNLSQTELAERVGVTYQMIQKYERGASTLAISRLSQIADALEVPLTFFLEPVPGVAENIPQLSDEEVKMVRLLRDMPDDRLKKSVMKLLKEAGKKDK